MNRSEFDQFFKESCIAFPGLKEWLASAADDPYATLTTWVETLERTTIDEARQVLSGWVAGKFDNPPVGYRREMFALDVRSIASRRRDDQRREQARQELFAKSNRGYERPKGIVAISPYLDRIFAEQQRYRDGEISDYELATLTTAIVEEFPV